MERPLKAVKFNPAWPTWALDEIYSLWEELVCHRWLTAETKGHIKVSWQAGKLSLHVPLERLWDVEIRMKGGRV